jgi:phosphatidylserine/phosphatidylglycerophosphate/cardiolipin synthase-like enzyme
MATDSGGRVPAPSATDGNRLTLFDEGEALFEQVAEAMRTARARLWVETFILTPDETGRATLAMMSDAARRGCDVVLLFDQLGSHVTNLGVYRPLEPSQKSTLKKIKVLQGGVISA